MDLNEQDSIIVQIYEGEDHDEDNRAVSWEPVEKTFKKFSFNEIDQMSEHIKKLTSELKNYASDSEVKISIEVKAAS